MKSTIIRLILVTSQALAMGCSNNGNGQPADVPGDPTSGAGDGAGGGDSLGGDNLGGDGDNVALCDNVTPVAGTPGLTVELVAQGFTRPVVLTSPPTDASRVFVAEQGGRIRIIRDGGIVATDFLDLGGQISCCGERGLLGLAFHPDFGSNGKFYVDYTDSSGDTRISELVVSTDPDVADASSERVLLTVVQPYSNHNGGSIAFGPDGYLYIGLGDGGSGGDPAGHGQNLSTLLGAILRIDVDSGNPYDVPADNPFLLDPGAQDQIFAYGLRNPWRFSFDRLTGDLYIGDVGQSGWEEIDVALASAGGGQNFGWNIMEGMGCYGGGACDPTGLTLPILSYANTGFGGNCSVTGGFVYRGCRMPGFHGTYFYGDYCSGLVRSFRYDGANVTDEQDWSAAFASAGVDQISSFGEDARGEIYILDYSDGQIFRIIPQ